MDDIQSGTTRGPVYTTYSASRTRVLRVLEDPHPPSTAYCPSTGPPPVSWYPGPPPNLGSPGDTSTHDPFVTPVPPRDTWGS